MLKLRAINVPNQPITQLTPAAVSKSRMLSCYIDCVPQEIRDASSLTTSIIPVIDYEVAMSANAWNLLISLLEKTDISDNILETHYQDIPELLYGAHFLDLQDTIMHTIIQAAICALERIPCDRSRARWLHLPAAPRTPLIEILS